MYSVNIFTSLWCTCMDFQRNRRPCKHLYFIICQVAQYEDLIESMPNKLQMSKSNFKKLSDKLRSRLGARLLRPELPKDTKPEDK